MSNNVDMFDWEAFDLADPPSLPFSPSVEQPIAPDFVDMLDWNAPDYQDLETVDWAALHEELKNGPFGMVWEDLDRAVLQPDR
jgi:hypothetical protein